MPIIIKKARHPVGLFRIALLDMTPVVSHDPELWTYYCCFVFQNILFMFEYILRK